MCVRHTHTHTHHMDLLPQAMRPSSHVCSKFGSSGFPHFPNQPPPAAQHVSLPVGVLMQLEQLSVDIFFAGGAAAAGGSSMELAGDFT